MRILGFLGAMAVGIVLGWRFFVAPAPVGGTTLSTATPTAGPGTPPENVLIPTSPTSTPRLSNRIAVGNVAPSFRLSLLGGGLAGLSDHRGRVVLINFWATWCPPCRYEMPALQQAYEEWEPDGFTVLGVNWTESDDPDQIGPYVEELGLTFPILLDEESLVTEDLYGVIGLPTSVFVDRRGLIRKVVVGPLNLGELRQEIRSLLAEEQ